LPMVWLRGSGGPSGRIRLLTAVLCGVENTSSPSIVFVEKFLTCSCCLTPERSL
jgi:hypothetical protein